MVNTISRRSFLRHSATLLSLPVLASFAPVFRSQPYRVALIGCGWYGKSDLTRLAQVTPIIVEAICDPDQLQLAITREWIRTRLVQKSKPAEFRTHVEMLREINPEIVIIGTPDHWHALTAIDSLKAGAHVYLQKPISVDVLEGEALIAQAQRSNRVVQVGLQRRSTPHLIDAKQRIIDAGKLGSIHYVEMFCHYHMRNNSNPPLQPIPTTFDYDWWTGPAPLRPFDGMPHRGWWRAFMEYGNGIMGDMCVHMLDAVRWMLNLGWPTRIYSTGEIYFKEGKSNITDTQTAIFDFDTLQCTWNHRTWGNDTDPSYPWGFKIFGEKGMLVCSPYRYDFKGTDNSTYHMDAIYEREKFPQDVNEPDIEIHAAPATRNQMLDFIHAIETGSKPVAGLQSSHISTASCILANISVQLQQPLTYHSDLKSLGNEAFDLFLKRPYRSGFKHPYT